MQSPFAVHFRAEATAAKASTWTAPAAFIKLPLQKGEGRISRQPRAIKERTGEAQARQMGAVWEKPSHGGPALIGEHRGVGSQRQESSPSDSSPPASWALGRPPGRGDLHAETRRVSTSRADGQRDPMLFACCLPVPWCRRMCSLGGSPGYPNSTVHVSACVVITPSLALGRDPRAMVVWGTPPNCRIYLIATSGEGGRSSGNSHSRKNEKLRER